MTCDFEDGIFLKVKIIYDGGPWGGVNYEVILKCLNYLPHWVDMLRCVTQGDIIKLTYWQTLLKFDKNFLDIFKTIEL